MRMKEETEKAGYRLNIQKTTVMASGPITSWQIEGEKVEAVTDFVLRGSKITVDSYCSHEIKRLLLLGRKVLTNIEVLVSQSCLTLCDHMDCSPPGSSLRGILQARKLDWVALPFSRGSS